MYRNTYVNISFNDCIGEEWQIRNGVRQGGILSTLLFSFYINDCIEAVTCLDTGCSIGFQRCNVLAYADDITLIAPSAKGLQTLIDVMSFSLRNICLKINVKKLMYMLFKCRKRSTVESSVHLFAEPLKRVFELKYLGIILTDDMSIGKDIDRVINSFLRQYNSMFYKFNFIDRNILFFLFKTYTSSFYGIELWYNVLSRDKNFP